MKELIKIIAKFFMNIIKVQCRIVVGQTVVFPQRGVTAQGPAHKPLAALSFKYGLGKLPVVQKPRQICHKSLIQKRLVYLVSSYYTIKPLM